jgi:hypothetical protein
MKPSIPDAIIGAVKLSRSRLIAVITGASVTLAGVHAQQIAQVRAI